MKAKEMYRKAVQLHPGWPSSSSGCCADRYVEALNNLGVACRPSLLELRRVVRELGEWEHAIEAYGMALKARMSISCFKELYM